MSTEMRPRIVELDDDYEEGVPTAVGKLSIRSLEDLASEISKLQKSADGTLAGSKTLLDRLRDYEALQSKETAPRPEFLVSLCEVLRPSRAVVVEGDIEKDPLKGLPLTPHTDIFQEISKIPLSILKDAATDDLLASDTELRNKMAVALATHSDVSVDWVSSENAQISKEAFEAHPKALRSPDVLVEHILKEVIKPVFGKGPRTVTDQGRKAIRVPPTRSDEFDWSDEKPWKKQRPEAMTLLMFVVKNFKGDEIQQNWHLIVPPILKALDEGDAATKAYACDILAEVIKRVDHQFLSRTGLGDVFQEAMSPCLHFLPPLTLINQAIRCFRSSVTALTTLAKVRYGQTDENAMYRAIDGILREGVFHGLIYASENVQMVEVFLQEARTIVQTLGIRSVRHLSKLLSLCGDQLMSPFITTYPRLALSACATLVELIRTCWPRIPDYGNEILRGTVLCWLRIREETDTPDLQSLRSNLKLIVMLLQRVDGDKGWYEEAKTKLVLKDDRLGELFL